MKKNLYMGKLYQNDPNIGPMAKGWPTDWDRNWLYKSTTYTTYGQLSQSLDPSIWEMSLM